MSSEKLAKKDFGFGPWTIHSAKGSILKSDEMDRLATELDIPALPEMLFGNNSLEINHEDGFSICFNAKEALKGVDNKHDLMHVAVAEEWQKLRADAENIKNVVKPYDWTYTTAYRGTFFDKRSSNTSKFVETDERIDLEKLKAREKIHFYEDILLFEDELGDNGMASMNIKIRVMPSSFFALLRFFLRVDNVLIRINDTRLYHEAGSSIILREYSSKEKKVSELKDPYADSSILADQLDLKLQCFEKLDFSKTANVKTEEASCHGDNQTR